MQAKALGKKDKIWEVLLSFELNAVNVIQVNVKHLERMQFIAK